jgi:hypothetical protein
MPKLETIPPQEGEEQWGLTGSKKHAREDPGSFQGSYSHPQLGQGSRIQWTAVGKTTLVGTD